MFFFPRSFSLARELTLIREMNKNNRINGGKTKQKQKQTKMGARHRRTEANDDQLGKLQYACHMIKSDPIESEVGGAGRNFVHGRRANHRRITRGNQKTRAPAAAAGTTFSATPKGQRQSRARPPLSNESILCKRQEAACRGQQTVCLCVCVLGGMVGLLSSCILPPKS